MCVCSVGSRERKVLDFFPVSSITTLEKTEPAHTFDNTPSTCSEEMRRDEAGIS